MNNAQNNNVDSTTVWVIYIDNTPLTFSFETRRDAEKTRNEWLRLNREQSNFLCESSRQRWGIRQTFLSDTGQHFAKTYVIRRITRGE